MMRAEMRAYLAEHPIDWPPLSPTQRLRLASLLRPDLPVGIRAGAPIGRSGSPDRAAPEAA